MDCYQSLPEQFLTRLKELIPAKDFETVAESFCTDKPITIRVNTLRTNKSELRDALKKHGISVSEVPWYKNAFTVAVPNKQLLTSLPFFESGDFYIQNLSSMIPVLALNPKPNEKILDMAAAPGSKTTHMAMLMNNTGEIIANDKSRQRLYKLQAVLNHQQVSNTKVICRPGEILWKVYPHIFDKVLVDAPCSMEGRFVANDKKTFEDWAPKKVKMLSRIQKWLLRSAITIAKPGGTIVYATCTMSPEENEEVIDWVLKNGEFPISIEPITLTSLPLKKPVMQWKKKVYDERIKNTARIYPSSSMEGFFIAKIKKLGV